MTDFHVHVLHCARYCERALAHAAELEKLGLHAQAIRFRERAAAFSASAFGEATA